MAEGISFQITADEKELVEALRRSRVAITTTANQAEQEGSRIESVFKKMTSAAAGYFSLRAAGSFIQQVVNVRSEFQNTEAMFKVFLGNAEKAKDFVKEIQGYAFNNVFEFKDLTQQAAQLLAFNTNLSDVIPTLDKLSNIAAGVNVPLEQLVGLFNKAQSRGKLDQRDIMQWSVMGDMVGYLATSLGKSTDEIRSMISAGQIGFKELNQVITDVTSEGGRFFGMMTEKMKTLGDSVGLLKDSITAMLNEIGESSQGVLRGGILAANYLVQNYKEVGEVLIGLIATYGTYKAAVVGVTVVERVHQEMQVQAALAGKALTSAQALQAVTIKNLTGVWNALNKAIFSNPAVLITAGLVGLTFAVYGLVTRTDEAEKAQKRLNNSIGEAETASLSEIRGLATLKGQLSAATKGTEEYNKIKETIVKNYGKYHAGLDAEIEKVGLLDSTYKSLVESITKSFGARQYEKFKKEQGDYLDEVTSKNFGKLQDRLTKELGEEAGAQIYSEIRNSVLQGEELSKDVIAIIDQVQGKGTKVADARIDGYINNVRNAQKATEEFDKKARVKFGIPDPTKAPEAGSGGAGTNTPPPAQNKEYWTKIKNDAQESLDLMDAAEKGSDKWNSLVAKIQQADEKLKGYSTSAGDKAASTALKDHQDLNKMILNAEISLRQSQIDILKDGQDKKLKQIALDTDKEVSAINEKYDKLKAAQNGGLTTDQEANKQTEIAAAQKVGTNKADEVRLQYAKEYSEVTKQITDVFLSDEERKRAAVKKTYDDLRKWAEEFYEGGGWGEKGEGTEAQAKYTGFLGQVDETEKKAKLKDLLDAYRTFEEQRTEINRKYDRERQEIEASGLPQDVIKGKLDRLEKERKNALKNVNNAEIAEAQDSSDLLVQIFTKASDMSRSRLKETMAATKNLIDYLEGVSDVLPEGIDEATIDKIKQSPEELKALYDQLQAQQDEFDRTSNYPFSNIIKGLGQLKVASESAQKALDETDKKQKKLYENQADIAQAKGINYIYQGVAEAANGVQFLADNLQKLAEVSGDERFKNFSDEMSAMAQNFSAAGQGAASGGWIGAVIGGLSDIITQTIGAFATRKAEEAEFKQNQTDFLNAYELLFLKINDKDYDDVFGSSALSKAADAAQKAREAMARYREELAKTTDPKYEKEFDNLGESIFFGIYTGFKRSQTNESKTLFAAYAKGYNDLQAMAVKTRDYSSWDNFWGKKDKYTSLKDLAPQLWDSSGDFNVDAAKAFLDTNTQISDEQRKQIQNVIDLKGAYDDNMQVVRDYIKDTFGEIGSLGDAIVEAFKDGTDAMDKWGQSFSNVLEKLGKQLMQKLFFQKYFDSLETIITYWINNENFSTEQVGNNIQMLLGNFFETMKSVVPQAEEFYANWVDKSKQYGFDLTGDADNRQASAKGFASMSQDSANELNGRFTAIQAQTFSINENVKILTANSVSMLAHINQINNDIVHLRRLEVIEAEIRQLRQGMDIINNRGIRLSS